MHLLIVYRNTWLGNSIIIFVIQQYCNNAIQYPRILKNNIYHSNKGGPPPLFHSDTNPVIGQVLIHSIDKTHILVVTMKLNKYQLG